jgi:hypothetical protein
MGDAVNISPSIPSTCVQHGVLSLQILHLSPRRQTYEVIDNPLLIPAVSWRTTSRYLWTYVHLLMMFLMLKTCKAMAASACLPCTNFGKGSKIPEFGGIVLSARTKKY